MEMTLELNNPLTEEERDKIFDVDLEHTPAIIYHTKHGRDVTFINPIRCKNCKYYEVKDYWGDFCGIPVLGASNRPVCMKWGGGDCATSPDGYCYLAEKREDA